MFKITDRIASRINLDQVCRLFERCGWKPNHGRKVWEKFLPKKSITVCLPDLFASDYAWRLARTIEVLARVEDLSLEFLLGTLLNDLKD